MLALAVQPYATSDITNASNKNMLVRFFMAVFPLLSWFNMCVCDSVYFIRINFFVETNDPASRR